MSNVRRWHLVVASALVFFLHVSLATAAPVDVSGKVTIQKSGLVLNRATNTFDTTLTIRNVSAGDVLAAPFYLIVSGLPSGVTLQNAAGVTGTGLRYVTVVLPSTGLIPGAQVNNVLLKFTNPSRVALTPTLSTVAEVPIANLPPDPGEAGKQTLAGIDRDTDGVRDDVQRFIAFNFLAHHKPVTQLARAFQKSLLATTREQALIAANGMSRAYNCLYTTVLTSSGTVDEQLIDTISFEIQANTANTKERARAYLDDSLLSGATIPAFDGNTCDQ